MRDPAPLITRIALGIRMRRQLRGFARKGAIRAQLTEARQFAAKARHRLAGSKKGLTPGGGGAVIAFVGSEASGKSTVLAATERWLGEHFTIERVHAGKPPSSLLSVLPNVFLPALRAVFPEQRSTQIDVRRTSQAASSRNDDPFPPLFAIRSVLLAYDRRRLLTGAHARAANGTIVLCDRYPSMTTGAPDSTQLSTSANATAGRPLRRWLAGVERRLYQQIPPPDLVFHLKAPLELTLERNRSRGKTEPEQLVRLRHAQTSTLSFERSRVYEIDTRQPLAESLHDIRQLIWSSL
jgi:thymidylate kinase